MRSQLTRLFQVLIPSFALMLSGLAEAATRVALVIGNDQYVNSPKLSNAANDARGIADALRSDLGFTLIGGGAQIDRSRGQALDLLEQFRSQSAGAEIALFYFAGHGIAEAGENWLMPSDDRTIAFREDVPLHALSQHAVLERMKGRVNVMVLDACRNNPLPSREGGRDATRGLQPKGGPRGTLVAYSAGLGEVASDGASFTRELLKRIRTPGLRLDDLFRSVGDSVYAASNQRQNPSIQDQLRDGAVYLLPASPPTRSPDAERLAFDAAQSSNNVASWEAYLKRHPDGEHAGVAEVQLAALNRPSSAPSPSPKPKPRDCPDCPEMIQIVGGNFQMGDLSGEGELDEKPVHDVSIRPFSVGKYEVAFAEWDACVAAGGCKKRPSDNGWGRDRRPVINVSWNDAQQYVEWLTSNTGKHYRLLTESEWEYVARAGTTTHWIWGHLPLKKDANFSSYIEFLFSAPPAKPTAPVGSYAANAWGLHDMYGNTSEWVEDCWHRDFVGAPRDGTAWKENLKCAQRVSRGGSSSSTESELSAADRRGLLATVVDAGHGFRVARTD